MSHFVRHETPEHPWITHFLHFVKISGQLSNTLLIFIRNPELGKVKTRLAQTLGAAPTLRVYQYLLEKTRLAVLAVDAHRILCYSDFVDMQDAWLDADFTKTLQHSGDLGARMEQAFLDAFAAGAEKVLIIGSDCPELSGAILQQAFAALDSHDAVLGPTPDGGYYLLGLKAPEPTVFHDMVWSVDSVRAVTQARLAQAGKTYMLLPELADVDTEADLTEELLTIVTSDK